MVETAERRRVVTRIPADADKSSRIAFGKRMKVAAYCRVSTDDEDQLTSYRVQKDYYTRYISNNEKVGICRCIRQRRYYRNAGQKAR